MARSDEFASCLEVANRMMPPITLYQTLEDVTQVRLLLRTFEKAHNKVYSRRKISQDDDVDFTNLVIACTFHPVVSPGADNIKGLSSWLRLGKRDNQT